MDLQMIRTLKSIALFALVTTSLNAHAFSGINSIDQVETDSMRANWDISGVNITSTFYVYTVDDGSYTEINSYSYPASSAIVSGLDHTTEYTLAVRVDEGSGVDSNTQTLTEETLTPATALFSGVQVSARTDGSEDTSNDIGVADRIEFFDNETFEYEEDGNTSSNSYSATVDPTSLSIMSCFDYSGVNDRYDIDLNLGFGSLSLVVHRMSGACDSQTVDCFIFQSEDTEGDQRLMEVSPGGCAPLNNDFNEFGNLLVDSIINGKSVSKSSSEVNDIPNLRVRDDGVLEVENFSTGDIDRQSISYTESVADLDLLPCYQLEGDFRKINLTASGSLGEIEIVEFQGMCNEMPTSCFVAKTQTGTTTENDPIYDSWLMETSPGGCSELQDYYENIETDIFSPYFLSGTEVSQAGEPRDPIARVRGLENGDLITKNLSSPEQKNIFVFGETQAQDAIPSCSVVDGEIETFSIIKHAQGADTETDDPLETLIYNKFRGVCDGVELDCFEYGESLLMEDVIDEETGDVLQEAGTTTKRLMKGLNGTCSPLESDFNERGSFLSSTLLFINNHEKEISVFSHGQARINNLSLEVNTTMDSSITSRDDLSDSTPSLKGCHSFAGVKEVRDIDIDGIVYRSSFYDGYCDGIETKCHILEDTSDGTKEIYGQDGDFLCSRLEEDFIDTGNVEGEAGSTAPPKEAEEVIDRSGLDYVYTYADQILTTGINPITKEPLDGSDWEVKYSEPFVGNCGEFSEHVYNDGDFIETINDYLPTSEDNCDTADYAPDTFDQIEWDNMGVVRKAEFGTETLSCGRDNSCDIDMQVTNSQDIFSSITPEKGEDGTSPARGRVFLYDFNSVNSSNNRGIGGAGGIANLAATPITEKYCIELKDYTTEGGGSDFAANPSLGVRVINWVPFNEGQDAAQGVTPDADNERSYIYKGLSDGILNYIKRDNIYLGEEWDE